MQDVAGDGGQKFFSPIGHLEQHAVIFFAMCPGATASQ